MDNAWKYQYDRYRDVFINVPMNGDIAGLCARTDFTHDAWYSPAGLNRGILKNIVRPTWDASKANRDELYKGGVNPITTQLGAGAILFGDKTISEMLSDPPLWFARSTICLHAFCGVFALQIIL